MYRAPRIASILLRMFADTVSLHLAAFAGYLFYFAFSSASQPRPSFDQIAVTAFQAAITLTIVSITIFYFAGFYTTGRAYSSRYKVLFVGQVATLAFLVFGTLSFFAPIFAIPRSAFIVAWGVGTFTLVCARVWATIWGRVQSLDTGVVTVNGPREIRRVLVIGGAGYVGSGLLPRMLKAGYKVRLLDLFIFGEEPIESFKNHPNLEIIRADFRQVDKIVTAMRGVDAVIHLGAIVGDPACALDEDLTVETNLIATRMIADVAKGQGISRFIFASTCSVYGACDEILDEHSVLNPVSLYARSKIASERVLLQMADASFSPVILRFGTIYGLSERTRFDLVVNLLTAKALVEGEIPVFGADQWRPFVHVNDAAKAVFTVLQATPELVDGEIFNVGSDEQNKTLGQVGEMIQKIVPTSRLKISGTDGDRRNYRVSFAKIRTQLGFKPDWSLESGIQQVYDAIASGRVLDYKHPRYSNVKFLTEENPPELRPINGWAKHLISETYQEESVH